MNENLNRIAVDYAATIADCGGSKVFSHWTHNEAAVEWLAIRGYIVNDTSNPQPAGPDHTRYAITQTGRTWLHEQTAAGHGSS